MGSGTQWLMQLNHRTRLGPLAELPDPNDPSVRVGYRYIDEDTGAEYVVDATGTVRAWLQTSGGTPFAPVRLVTSQTTPARSTVPQPPAVTGVTHNVGAARVAPYDTIPTAIVAAAVGDELLLDPETFTEAVTLLVNKQLTIRGSGVGVTIVRTPGAAGDPVTLFSCTADGVVLRDFTAQQRKTVNTSVETCIAFNNAGVAVTNSFAKDLAVETMEFGIIVRGNGCVLDGVAFAYVGAAANNHRMIELFGNAGEQFVASCMFTPSADVPARTRAMLLSTSGGDTWAGRLNVYDNTVVGPNLLFQFIIQETFAGVAGGFQFDVRGNIFNGTSANVVLFESSGTAGQPLSLYDWIIVSGNVCANTCGKGVLAIDGSAGPGQNAGTTTLYASTNTIANPTIFAANFASATTPDTGLAGYKTTVFAAVSLQPFAGPSGLAPIDGVVPVAGDRVLNAPPFDSIDAGVYLAAAGPWTRALDMPTGTPTNILELSAREGTTYGGTRWIGVSPPGSDLAGMNAIRFRRFAFA